MVDTLIRATAGFVLFVLATVFAILAAPILLPALFFLSGHPRKPEVRERRSQPLLEKPNRISVSA